MAVLQSAYPTDDLGLLAVDGDEAIAAIPPGLEERPEPALAGALDAEAVVIPHRDDAHAGGTVEDGDDLIAHGVALGQPADGV